MIQCSTNTLEWIAFKKKGTTVNRKKTMLSTFSRSKWSLNVWRLRVGGLLGAAGGSINWITGILSGFSLSCLTTSWINSVKISAWFSASKLVITLKKNQNIL